MRKLYARMCVGQLDSVRCPQAQRLSGGKMFRQPAWLSDRTAVLSLLPEKRAKRVITAKTGPTSDPPTDESSSLLGALITVLCGMLLLALTTLHSCFF